MKHVISHRPDDYVCPFCGIVSGENAIQHAEIVYQDADILCFPSRDWWPNNPGHVLIVPKQHFENIYELPFHISDRIHRLAKCVAIAFKEIHACDGVSTRQHNEPAGNQDVWHYHLHVFPRYKDDNLYMLNRKQASQTERVRHANMLRDHFKTHPPNLDD